MEKIIISGIMISAVVFITSIISMLIRKFDKKKNNKIIKQPLFYVIVCIVGCAITLLAIFIAIFYPDGKGIIFGEGMREITIGFDTFFFCVMLLLLLYSANWKIIIEKSFFIYRSMWGVKKQYSFDDVKICEGNAAVFFYIANKKIVISKLITHSEALHNAILEYRTENLKEAGIISDANFKAETALFYADSKLKELEINKDYKGMVAYFEEKYSETQNGKILAAILANITVYKQKAIEDELSLENFLAQKEAYYEALGEQIFADNAAVCFIIAFKNCVFNMPMENSGNIKTSLELFQKAFELTESDALRVFCDNALKNLRSRRPILLDGDATSMIAELFPTDCAADTYFQRYVMLHS